MDAKVSQEGTQLLTRREALKQVAAAFGLAGFIAACSRPAQPTITAPRNDAASVSAKYTGPVGEFKDYPMVQPSEMAIIYQALDDTKHPLFQKISRTLQALATSTNRPRGFPQWIDERTYTLPIVKNATDMSGVQHEPTLILPEEFLYINYGQTEPRHLPDTIGKIAFAINLALQNRNISTRHPFLGAFLAAKELLSFELLVDAADDNYRISTELGLRAFSDTKGQPITDPEFQKRIGLRIFRDQFYRKKGEAPSDYWIFCDRFPMLLMEPALSTLDRSSQLVRDLFFTFSYLPANLARYQAMNPQIKTNLSKIADQWTNSDDLLLPSGTVYRGLEMGLLNELRAVITE